MCRRWCSTDVWEISSWKCEYKSSFFTIMPQTQSILAEQSKVSVDSNSRKGGILGFWGIFTEQAPLMAGGKAIKWLVTFYNQDNLSHLKKSHGKSKSQDSAATLQEKHLWEGLENSSQFTTPILVNPEAFYSALIYTVCWWRFFRPLANIWSMD